MKLDSDHLTRTRLANSFTFLCPENRLDGGHLHVFSSEAASIIRPRIISRGLKRWVKQVNGYFIRSLRYYRNPGLTSERTFANEEMIMQEIAQKMNSSLKSHRKRVSSTIRITHSHPFFSLPLTSARVLTSLSSIATHSLVSHII